MLLTGLLFSLSMSAYAANSLSVSASEANAPDVPYRADVEAWRVRREQRLRSETGWLATAGLFWIKPGKNVLPKPFDKAGWFELQGEKVVAHVGPKAQPLEDDETDLHWGRYVFEAHASGKRRAIRVWDKENPRRKSFPGLNWYGIDESYRVVGRFVSYEKPRQIVVRNLAGDSEKTAIPGYVEFSLRGKPLRLTGWIEDSKLFFVFRDRTSGKTTYPTARFLIAELPKDGQVLLDFNKAYNPPCAFSPYATCPLPPPDNKLDVDVDAGEKLPPGAHK